MESEGEFQRLEQQSAQHSYRVEDELGFLDRFSPVFAQGRVLDAGCGSGVVCQYLINKYPDLVIEACDISDLRLRQTKKHFIREKERISFFQGNLDGLELNDEKYDLIISRYVYEYLKDPIQVTKKLRRSLKKGGLLCLVDTDGVFVNFYTADQELNHMIRECQNKISSIDFFAGRKLRTFLEESGFSHTDSHLSTYTFKGEKEISCEVANMHDRLKFATNHLNHVFKDQARVEKFKGDYIKAMRNSSSTLFFNKFVAWGINE